METDHNVTTTTVAPDEPGTHQHGKARTGFSRTVGWLDDRLGLSALRYKVPAHANTLWYTLGGITFVGIVFLVLTGIWLAQYYNPSPADARASVIYIQNVAPFGDVIRGIHVWLAYLVVISAALHLIRVFVSASYKIPREINWLVGLGLLGLLLFGAVFTGTVLRWDQEAFEALRHNTEIAALFGAVGGFFSSSFTVSVPILTRLYITHVSIVPVLLLLLLIVHIFLIKHHEISPTAAQADRGEAPNGKLPEEKVTDNYTNHVRLMLGYGLVLFGLAGVLGVLFPQAIGAAPNPLIENSKPSFLFYWMYAFENWFGVRGILYSSIVFFGLLALVPFVDRTPLRRLRHRRVMAIFGVIVLVIILVMSILVAVTPATNHMGG